MSKDTEVVVVGSHAPGILLRVKRIPKSGETIIGWDFQEPIDGGKGSNQAIAASLLGAKTSFVGCVGKDRIGDDGEKWMREAGVDTTWLLRHETVSSGVGFILLAENGIPSMVTSIGANAELTRSDIEKAITSMPNARIILTQFEMPIEIAVHSARFAKEKGIISIINPAPAPEEPIDGLDVATILIPNETEAQILLGREPGEKFDAIQMVEELHIKTNTPAVIITLGEEGAVGIDDEGPWQVDAPTVNIVDTSGAGDVFCSALAVAIVNGKSIREASSWACKVASFSVTRPGTIPSYPTKSEIKEYRERKQHLLL